jgi:hypothetical protein
MGRPLIDLDDREALGHMLDEEYLHKLELTEPIRTLPG